MKKPFPPKVEKICLCGCGEKFTQSIYLKGYIQGHHLKGKPNPLKQGKNNPFWKGGITIKRGYVFVHSPNHPNNDGGYVKRSRLTMEKKLGRYLKTAEFVHHINGIKDDDRIENLFLTTLVEHNHIHISLKNRQRNSRGRLV